MVLQEDQRCNNNNSSSGGRGGAGGGGNSSRSCKKAKQDKIPQRGLGVAELERILQDQQRNIGSSAIAMPSSSSSLVLQPPLSLPRLPHPSTSANDLSSSSFRTGTIATTSNIFGNQSSTLTMPLSSLPLPILLDCHAVHGRSIGAITAGGHATNVGLPYTLPNDSLPDPIWWCPPQSQRRTQSTTKSASSLLPTSSGTNIQMEPPSNQIPFSSNYSTLLPSPWTEDERTGSIKRPWPFPFESAIAPGPSKIPNSFSKPDHELPLPVYGTDAFRTEQRNNTSFSHSSAVASAGSAPYPVDYRSMVSNYHQWKSLVDTGNLKESGLFPLDHHLRLPIPPPPVPSSFKYKQQINIPPANYMETPEFNRPPSSFSTNRRSETEISRGTSLQKPFYEFLPTEPICSGTSSNKEEEEEDSIDLQLKL